MTDTDNTQTVERWGRIALIVVVVLSIMTAGAAAQVTQSDDFEDGNIDGWSGANTQVSTLSTEGNYSFQQQDGYGSFGDRGVWEDGPTLDMSQDFTISGTVRAYQGDGGERVRFGLINDNDDGAMIVMSDEYAATFLAVTGGEDPDAQGLDTINNDFDATWVNFVLSNTDGTLTAKIWEVGTSEPSSPQLSRSFSQDISGKFSTNPGTAGQNRDIRIDSITLEGSTPTTTTTDSDESLLSLNTQSLIPPNQTRDYSVTLSGAGDVTSGSTVVSNNTSVLTVDQTNHTLTAVNNTNISTTVDVTANYTDSSGQQYNVTKTIVVAEPTVENLAILPGIWRANALVADSTIYALIIAMLLAVPTTRFTSAFGGLAVGQMVMVVGWFGGYVSWAIAASSLFVALFIGLNLAANVDYGAANRVIRE